LPRDFVQKSRTKVTSLSQLQNFNLAGPDRGNVIPLADTYKKSSLFWQGRRQTPRGLSLFFQDFLKSRSLLLSAKQKCIGNDFLLFLRHSRVCRCVRFNGQLLSETKAELLSFLLFISFLAIVNNLIS